jgi:hypothetical protein
MRGTILPLPNTSSWRGAYLSTGTTFTFIDKLFRQPACLDMYEGVSISFRTGHLEREMQVVQLPATIL